MILINKIYTEFATLFYSVQDLTYFALKIADTLERDINKLLHKADENN